MLPNDIIRLRSIMRKFLGSSIFLTAVTVTFLWCYLLRIGRQDIFLDAVTFNELFSFSGVVFISSVFLFSFIFFMPSFYSCLIIQRKDKKYDDYEIVRANYIRVFFSGTLLSIILLMAFSNFSLIYSEKIQVAWLMLVSSVFCIILSTILNRKVMVARARNLQGWKLLSVFYNLHLCKPFLLGMASWLFIFPMAVLTKTLQFRPGDGDDVQAFTFGLLSVVILVVTLIPGMFFLQKKEDADFYKRTISTVGSALVVLAMLSPFLPVIPALIMNFAVKLAGVNDMTPIPMSVSTESRPAEMFRNANWHLQKSSDGKFLLFDGVTLFSFGTVRLVCPPDVADAYRESHYYILASKSFDDDKRAKLREAARSCQIFSKDELRK